MHNMQPARISIWQARSALIPCYRPASRLPGFAMASSVSGSDVSQAHQAANQAGEEATRGTTPAKLQSAAAKGYSAEQTAQSLKDAPRANLDDPKVRPSYRSYACGPGLPVACKGLLSRESCTLVIPLVNSPRWRRCLHKSRPRLTQLPLTALLVEQQLEGLEL